MKRVPLLTVPGGQVGGRDFGDLDYAAALSAAVQSKENGMTTAELFQSVKVMAAIETARKAGADVVLMEDDAHKYLVSRLETNRWLFASVPLADMIQAVRDAETFDPNKPTDLRAAA